MKVCRDVEEWIEEHVEQEIEKQEQRCKKWPWPLSWLCSLVTFIVKIIVVVWTKVIRVVCEVIAFAWNVIAAILNFVLQLPIIGPLVRAVIRAITTVLSYVVGLIDGLARLIGIRLTKHLRVHVIPLSRGNAPLAFSQHLQPIMAQTEATLYRRGQIRVHTTYHDPIRNPPESSLRIGTEGDLILDEAWLKGSWFQAQANKLFESGVWRLFGIGQPVIVFVVEEVGYDGIGGVVGCSGGPFIDWVAVEVSSVVPQVIAGTNNAYPPTVADGGSAVAQMNASYAPFAIAHEICHTLGLLGHANANAGELMVSGTITGDALSPFQVGLIRSSPRVTFL